MKKGLSISTLNDDELQSSKARVAPIIDYILTRYPQVALDPMNPINAGKIRTWGPFDFLGEKALPLAIALSQYGYDVRVVVPTFSSKVRVKVNAERHAGIFKDVVIADYPGPVPEGSILFVIDTISERKRFREIRELIKTWLRNHHEVVCVLPRDRNWSLLMTEDFSVSTITATYDDVFIAITSK
jgi:hypothetical protein